MANTLLPIPRQVFYSVSGAPLAGGKVYTYIPGGSTPKNTWQDAAGTILNANPIVLDSAGSCVIYGSGDYQITVQDSLGNSVPAYSGLSEDTSFPLVAVNASIAALSPSLLQFATATGTSDAITAAYATPNTSLTDGLKLGFRASAANATTAPTFAPDGLTAQPITYAGGQALVPGSIPGLFAEMIIRYNLANTRWELLNPAVPPRQWAVAGGTSDVITVTISPAIPAYYDGLRVYFRATAANTTATPTVNVNGLGAKTITKSGGVSLAIGDIPGALAEVFLVYNAANNRFEYLNSPPTRANSLPVPANLKVSANAGAATVTITTDAAILSNGTGGYLSVTAVSVTINSGTSGANGLDSAPATPVASNTLYSLWLISNGAATAGLMSLSATSPTMPSGYTFKYRVGWIKTGAVASQNIGLIQYGREAQLIVDGTVLTGLPVLQSGATGSTTLPTYSAKAVANLIPTTASAIMLVAQSTSSASSGNMILAPNGSYGALGSTTNPPPFSNQAGIGSSITRLVLEGPNIYVACGASNVVVVLGWEDNL